MDSFSARIQQKDGYQTRVFCYETSKETILGNILILHGMAEHHKRYMEFIQVLTNEGFDVYTYDHRGHGTDQKLSDLGFFANKGGDSLVVNDALTVCRYIKDTGRSEKLAIFGHSMGSIILRCLIQQYDEMNCAIVSSTAFTPVTIANIGIFLGGLLCRLQGPKKRSPYLNKVLFGGKLYTSLCTRTTNDWLTRNNTIVGKYMDDPYCGFICTTSFYRDLTRLSKRAALKRNIAKTRKNLPIQFFAGDKDPVGGYAKHVIKLYKTFQALGFTNTALTLYSEARHELLNELNAEEVMQDAIAFFHKHLD